MPATPGGPSNDEHVEHGGEPDGPRPLVRYATEVIAVGELTPDFLAQGMLVLFGELAPEELHDFVVRHRPSVVGSVPVRGDVVELDGEPFVVTSVGDVAEANLINLGHVCIKADGSDPAPLPGDVCVEARPLPALVPGSTVRILGTTDSSRGTS